MKTITPVKGLLALLLLWAGCSQAATYNCYEYSNWPAKPNVFTLNDVISVGEDLPVGSVIYHARLWSDHMGIRCVTSDASGLGIDIYTPARVEVINNPTSVVPGVTAPPTGGVIYETNVPGIGVSITADGGKLPYEWATARTKPTILNMAGGGNATYAQLNLNLIKTGPISPGIVNAINFPQLQVTFITPTEPAGSTFTGFPIPYSTISYNGTIQIVKSTCRAEVVDKVVDMGSYPVKDLKNASAGELPWTDASLRLIGCQFSPGFYNENNMSILDNNSVIVGTSDVGRGTPNANTVRLSLSSTTPVITPHLGLIELTPSPDNATGVGIQIGVKKGTVIQPFNFNTNEVVFTPSSPDAQSLEIPIFARYKSTALTATPGKANGAVVYTLNYY